MHSYSNELKEKLIEKMLSNNNTSIVEMSRESGIHENTLVPSKFSANIMVSDNFNRNDCQFMYIEF